MPALSPTKNLQIILSYAFTSSRDRKLFEQFCTHLSVLQYTYPTCEWYTRDLSGESTITQFIEGRLQQVNLIILFISADFMASCKLEMQQALVRIAMAGARLIPVLLRQVAWQGLPLERYEPLPSNGRPVNKWSDHDDAFVSIIEGLRHTLDELMSSPTSQLRRTLSIQTLPTCEPPYAYDDLFTDRRETIAEIKQRFASVRSGRTAMVALSGVGGIGKTAVALEYAYLAGQTHQKVLWFNASSRAILHTFVGAVADQLPLPPSIRQDEQQLFATIKQVLREHAGWLLVLDQIEDMSLIDLIVPPLSAGQVLLTTRAQSTRRHGSLLELSSLAPEDGAVFLLRRIQLLPPQASLEQVPTEVAHAAQEIVRGLAGHPLAIDQFAASIEQQTGDRAAMLTRYQQRFTGQPGDQVQADSTQTETGSAMRASELVSDTLNRDLLYLLAFLQPDAILPGLIVQGSEALSEPLHTLAEQPRALYQALETLRQSSLLRYQADSALLQMQRTVQDQIIASLEPEQQRYWAEQAVRMVNHAFPVIHADTRALCERYLPQAEHCATLITGFQLTLQEGPLLLERLGAFCLRRASYESAEEYLRQALHLYEQHWPTEVLDIAQTLSSLGRLEQRRGHYKRAGNYHQRAWQLREQALGPEDPQTAQSLHNFALARHNLGNYQEAEQFYQRALTIHMQTTDPDDPAVADTLNNLALLYSQQGRYAKAQQTYRRALAIYRKARGSKHPDLAYPLNGLGALAEQRGNYSQAEKYYQQALRIRQQASGAEDPDVAYNISRLAGLALAQQQYKQAAEYYQQAQTISEKLLGPHHPLLATILNDQALLATAQGQYTEARQLYQHSLRIYRLVLGTEHPAVASVLYNQGQLFRLLRDTQRAEKILRRALAIRQKALAPTHPDIAQSRDNLASLLAEQ